MVRVLVTGSHKRSDRNFIFDRLDNLHGRLPIDLIIEGGAQHVDHIASDWSRERLGKQSARYVAEWNSYGDKAGTIRNTRMLVEGKPDIVMAFWGEGGTANMVRQTEEAVAKGASILIVDYRPKPPRVYGDTNIVRQAMIDRSMFWVF
jgi:hypothetical protein